MIKAAIQHNITENTEMCIFIPIIASGVCCSAPGTNPDRQTLDKRITLVF